MTTPVPVRFAALVLAREDEGLLEPCARNLRRIGFDHVEVICVEEFHTATAGLKTRFADDPGIGVTAAPTEITDPAAVLMSGPIIGPLLARHPAEWLLVIDCDEFPVVDGGRIDDIADLDTADAVVIPRYNYARRAGEDRDPILARMNRLDDVPLITERSNMMAARKSKGTPRWSLHAIGPKLMLRPSRFGALTAGGHGTAEYRGPGDAPVQIETRHMLIAHFPFTSYERFHQKVVNARAHLNLSDLHKKPGSAWHWKWWIERLDQDGLADEYRREAFDDTEYAAGLDTGAIRLPAQIFPGPDPVAADDGRQSVAAESTSSGLPGGSS